VKGTASRWYKSVLKNPAVEIEVSGKKAAGKARPIKDRPGIRDTLDRFAAKYGAGDVKKYYPGQDVALELSLV